MGGKGGGGGGGSAAQLPDRYANMRARGIDPDKWMRDKSYNAAIRANNLYGLDYNPDGSKKAPPAPPAPAPAPAPAAAPAPEPAAPAPAPVPQGTPLEAGGAIDQPLTGGNSEKMGLGDELGGAVLKPPQYWVGGVNAYDVADTSTGRNTQGSLKTTQT